MVAKLELVLLLTDLLAIALPRKRLFHAFLLTGLQIKRVTLDFLDNVFSLHLALEAPQGILKGFAFLYSNLCQEKYTSKQSQSGYLQNTPDWRPNCIKFVANMTLRNDESQHASDERTFRVKSASS
jgi:hypothetical protein